MQRPKELNYVTSLPDNAIEIRNLCKTYKAQGKSGEHQALDNLNLDIPRGSFFGLLGPNGAGKSTLINILAGLALKTSGSATIWGHDITDAPRRSKRAIGIVPQELNIDPYFSAREALEVQAGLYGVAKKDRRTDEILEAVGLTDKADAYARSLSGGMRRRLLIAKALVHTPPVLVLDEPTAGVDVELRCQLWAYVRKLNAEGVTILLTTHYLEEAEELCDRIAIINHGKLIACDTTKNLMGKLDSKRVSVMLVDDLSAIPDALKKFNVTLKDPRELEFIYQPSQVRSSDIIVAVQEAGLKFAELTTKEPELED
ncbi:MAG: ABC transporter ATP-binding protein, partial [Magnetovibrio sp.]|nr:ABC transporter ATP-binding protein [Magnetovibrio sp.]